jgi:hypothetical protein
LEDTGIAGRIILKYIEKIGWEVVEWIDVALYMGNIAGCHEHNSAHFSSKNARGFLGYLRTYWPRKNNFRTY